MWIIVSSHVTKWKQAWRNPLWVPLWELSYKSNPPPNFFFFFGTGKEHLARIMPARNTAQLIVKYNVLQEPPKSLHWVPGIGILLQCSFRSISEAFSHLAKTSQPKRPLWTVLSVVLMGFALQKFWSDYALFHCSITHTWVRM